MTRFTCLVLMSGLLGVWAAAAHPRSAAAAEASALNLIPLPQSVTLGKGSLALTTTSRIVAADATLAPVAAVLSDELYRLTGVRMAAASGVAQAGDISLVLDPGLTGEAYSIETGDRVVIAGGDQRGVAWGRATLLQAVRRDGESAALPRLAVRDEPAFAFRSVMLDVARRWHPVETIKDTITLLSLFKIRFLHLHLSDNQSFTFASQAFPTLATPNRSYSPEEMSDLVRYADARGVTIIPEIDIPGHSGSWVGKLPDLFGTTDPATGQSRGVGIVNMANEKAYTALATLIDELCETFHSSPYIHLGADETSAAGLVALPEYLPYVRAHGLKEAEQGKSHELFAHFVVRMSELVKAKGRKLIVWNGFPSAGTENVKVPADDILIMSWAGSPLPLLDQGFEIVNCCWLPLYIVPPQGRAPVAEWIYDWNPRESGRWGVAQPVVMPADAKVCGAQICFWEQRFNEVLPMLRSRVPALSERLWNLQTDRPFAAFSRAARETDRVFERIAYPVSLEVKGLIDPSDVAFEKTLEVRLTSSVPGTIRYTLSKPWEEAPSADSPVYDKPIVLDDTTTVSAQLFDAAGRSVGGVTRERFRRIVPAYRYEVMGPSPQPIWQELPDFSTLSVLRTGVTGLMSPDRGEQINRSMFAGLPPHGHIDVRVHGLWNPYAIRLTGQLRIPADGEYEFKVRARDGQATLLLGEKAVCETRQPGAEVVARETLKAGNHAMTIRHYWRNIFNDLNVQVRVPGSEQFEPLETLVVPIAEWTETATP